MKTHHLRTDPAPFNDLWKDRQKFQCRPDNEFAIGDTLCLQETATDTENPMAAVVRPDYTGREIHASVTHIMRGPIYGIGAGWVCMSISVFFKTSSNHDSR